MYPHERSLVKQLADKPFAIIGVNSDQDLMEIREIVKEKNLTWRSFQDEQGFGAISSQWGIRGWPTVFILDAEGKIRHRDVRGDQLDAAIEDLLEEMGHTVKISHEEEEADGKIEATDEDKSDQSDDDDGTDSDDDSDVDK